MKLFVSLFHQPGYAVNAQGSVYSMDRTITRSDGVVVRIRRKKLKPVMCGKYLAVDIQGKKVYVHRLMLYAFRGPPKEGQISRHLNDDRFDNRIANLRWGTPAENMSDAKRNGKLFYPSKLTRADVKEIRRRRKEYKTTFRELGAEFGVARSTVMDACNRRTWKEVK